MGGTSPVTWLRRQRWSLANESQTFFQELLCLIFQNMNCENTRRKKLQGIWSRARLVPHSNHNIAAIQVTPLTAGLWKKAPLR